MTEPNQGSNWWQEIGGKEVSIALISALILGFAAYVFVIHENGFRIDDLDESITELKSEVKEKDAKIKEADNKLAGLTARIESVEKKTDGMDTQITDIYKVMRASADDTRNLLLRLIVEKPK